MWPFKKRDVPLSEAVLIHPSFVEGFQPALAEVKARNAKLDAFHEELRRLRYNNAMAIMKLIDEQYGPRVTVELAENSTHRLIGPVVKIKITRRADSHANCFHIYSFSDGEDSKKMLLAIAEFLEG